MVSLTSCGICFAGAGVNIVSPRLLGFLRGGVGGFTNDGESMLAFASDGTLSGKLVVEDALPGCLVVFTARFFRLRPFLGGGCFCSSKKTPLWSSAVLGRNMPTENVLGGGDSGEEPGEGSVALESSTVDIVVVGDESLDPVVLVESLKLWLWNLLSTPSYSDTGKSALGDADVEG